MKIEELKYVNGVKHASYGIGFRPIIINVSIQFYHNK